MSDVASLSNFGRPHPNESAATASERRRGPQEGSATSGPFDRLLRDMQSGARLPQSRLDERGAAQMFDSNRSTEESSRLDASREAERARDAKDDRSSHDERFAASTLRSGRADGFDSGSRDPQGRLGAPSNGEPLHAAPRGEARAGSPQPGETATPEVPQAGASASPRNATEPVSQQVLASARGTGALGGAATGSAPPHGIPASAKPVTTSVVVGADGENRATNPAQKLAIALTRLVGEDAEAPTRTVRSFQSVLARTTAGSGKQVPTSATDSAQDDPHLASGPKSEVASEPSPFGASVRSIRMQGGESRSSARIRLNPPELGSMTVHVRVKGGQIRVDVRTETAEAARRLLSRAEDLKTALRQHGLSIEAVEVDAVGTLSNEPRSPAASTHLPLWFDETRRHGGSDERDRSIHDRTGGVPESTSLIRRRQGSRADRNTAERRLNLEA